MKIFIPSYKDANPYLEEIINFTSSEFIFDHFKNYIPEYEIVNIHWPEALFAWKEPTKTELEELKIEIIKWKRFSKLVYTYHDERSHFGMTPNYLELFNLIEKSADGFIHLGEFSKRKMKLKYPNAKHCVIQHPLYENSFKKLDKLEARRRMNIDTNSLVLIAPGRIRNIEEKKMLLKAFKSVSKKNKVLISNRMLPFVVRSNFRGRVKLKRFFDINKFLIQRMKNKYLAPKYIFNYGFTNFEDFSVMLSAADIIFIPRINLLNSGNVFLGLTYEKIIIGPNIGNIEEVLSEFNFPAFNPFSDKSIHTALKEGIRKFETGDFDFPNEVLYKYHPKEVAKNMDVFFENLV